jgi:hypothetical protein
MPLIEIHALPQADVDRATIARAVNRAVAEVLGARLDAVWTIWKTFDGPFVKGDAVGAGTTMPGFGPIVHIYHHRTPEQVERIEAAIETVLAEAMNRAATEIFITSQPVAIDDLRA